MSTITVTADVDVPTSTVGIGTTGGTSDLSVDGGVGVGTYATLPGGISSGQIATDELTVGTDTQHNGNSIVTVEGSTFLGNIEHSVTEISGSTVTIDWQTTDTQYDTYVLTNTGSITINLNYLSDSNMEFYSGRRFKILKNGPTATVTLNAYTDNSTTPQSVIIHEGSSPSSTCSYGKHHSFLTYIIAGFSGGSHVIHSQG
jgi:hypothetical protein